MRKSVFDRLCAFGIADTRSYFYKVCRIGHVSVIYRQPKVFDFSAPAPVWEPVSLTGEEVREYVTSYTCAPSVRPEDISAYRSKV